METRRRTDSPISGAVREPDGRQSEDSAKERWVRPPQKQSFEESGSSAIVSCSQILVSNKFPTSLPGSFRFSRKMQVQNDNKRRSEFTRMVITFDQKTSSVYTDHFSIVAFWLKRWIWAEVDPSKRESVRATRCVPGRVRAAENGFGEVRLTNPEKGTVRVIKGPIVRLSVYVKACKFWGPYFRGP